MNHTLPSRSFLAPAGRQAGYFYLAWPSAVVTKLEILQFTGCLSFSTVAATNVYHDQFETGCFANICRFSR